MPAVAAAHHSRTKLAQVVPAVLAVAVLAETAAVLEAMALPILEAVAVVVGRHLAAR